MNDNAEPVDHIANARGNVAIRRSFGDRAVWLTCDTVEALLAEIDRGAKSAADEFNSYMDEAVSRSPSPLKMLGEYLAGVLDEDQWKTAERYLNAVAIGAGGA